MPYASAFLRKLRLPLSIVGMRKNSQTDLNIPVVGLADLSLYNIIMDVVSANNFEERFTATAGQTVFTIANSLVAASGNIMPVSVYRNGLKLKWVASAPAAGQFTYSGSTITTSSSTVGDIVIVNY